MGRAAKEAVPAIIKVMQQDKDRFVKCQAATTLGEIGAEKEETLPALISALQDGDVTWEVMISIRSLGPAAQAAVPVLIDFLDDERYRVRQYAAHALGAIGSEAQSAVPALRKALEDRYDVRSAAAEALWKIRPQEEEIPALIDILRYGESAGVTGRAVNELGNKGPAVVPLLLEVLKNEDETRRCSAAEAIGKIGPEAAEAVPVLIDLWRNDCEKVRRELARALGKMGVAAVPELIEILKKEKGWWVKKEMSEALGKMGTEAKEAVPALRTTLRDLNWDVRKAAVKALERIGPAAWPELSRALVEDDLDRDMRKRVLQALGVNGYASWLTLASHSDQAENLFAVVAKHALSNNHSLFFYKDRGRYCLQSGGRRILDNLSNSQKNLLKKGITSALSREFDHSSNSINKRKRFFSRP